MDPLILFLSVLSVSIIVLFLFAIWIRKERIEIQKQSVVGDMKYSAQTSDYPSWMICNGRSLDRHVYHDLFKIIGTNYGSVSSDTFNIPDCRGRVLGAIGQGSNLSNRMIGTNVGEETHTMTISEMVQHGHTGTTDISGNHTHSSNATGDMGLITRDGQNTATDTDSSVSEPNIYRAPESLVISSNGNHTHTFTSNTTGNTQAFNVMQPTLFAGNVFIYYGDRH